MKKELNDNKYMKTYTIKFFCGTDLRCEVDVVANNELIALAIAFNDPSQYIDGSWVISPEYKITIGMKE